jgi:hypothetical protein
VRHPHLYRGVPYSPPRRSWEGRSDDAREGGRLRLGPRRGEAYERSCTCGCPAGVAGAGSAGVGGAVRSARQRREPRRSGRPGSPSQSCTAARTSTRRCSGIELPRRSVQGSMGEPTEGEKNRDPSLRRIRENHRARHAQYIAMQSIDLIFCSQSHCFTSIDYFKWGT